MFNFGVAILRDFLILRKNNKLSRHKQKSGKVKIIDEIDALLIIIHSSHKAELRIKYKPRAQFEKPTAYDLNTSKHVHKRERRLSFRDIWHLGLEQPVLFYD